MKKIFLAALVFLTLVITPVSTVKANVWCGTGFCGLWISGANDVFIPSSTHPSFQLVFDKESTYDSQNSRYYVCPGSQLSLQNIAVIHYSCENAFLNNINAPLVAWVYDGNNKLAMTYNNMGPDSTLNRKDLVPATFNRGACIHYASGGNSLKVYTFTDPSIDYKTYIDFVGAWCGGGRQYICAASGWSTTGWSCYPYSGWVPQKQFHVKVLGMPTVGITAPQPVTANRGAVVSLNWVITNTGADKENIYVAKDCGGWNCNFVGYTENSAITLTPGQSYNVFMNLNTPASGTCGTSAGITVTYDDGYGFSCIQPASTKSMVQIFLNGCTTTSTTSSTSTTTSSTSTSSTSTTSSTSSSSTSSTTSTSPASSTTSSSSTSSTTTTLYTRSVTLKYNVTDDHAAKLNCSLWTNISGTWKIEKTYTNINKLEAQYFRINNVSEGTYAWTANCTDGVNTPSSYPYNAHQTSAQAPGVYWTFNVKAT